MGTWGRERHAQRAIVGRRVPCGGRLSNAAGELSEKDPGRDTLGGHGSCDRDRAASHPSQPVGYVA
jgi:hypothetical protein